MAEEDFPIAIPAKAVLEELTCPVCFRELAVSTMTPCGHNFCFKCIDECLARKQICPMCNKPVAPAALIKNHHLDKLIAIVQKERDHAAKLYFDKMFAQAPAPAAADGRPGDSAAPERSPLELIFQRYMRAQLLGYERFQQELRIRHELSKIQIKEETTALLRASPPDAASRIQRQADERVAELETHFAASSALLLQQYEESLSRLVVAPVSLPVTVVFQLETAPDRQLPPIELKSSHTLRDVRASVAAALGVDTSVFGLHNAIVLKPFADSREEFVLVETRPVLEQRQIHPGQVLVMKGTVRALSSQCYALTYDKANPAATDFFKCTTCDANWICPSCATRCHSGHNVTLFIGNHRPTWACCYCKKVPGRCLYHSAAGSSSQQLPS
eukprot:TRINITY_DN3968_c0_g1_i1.p1 TRINITY_DN3968_c0_g1~~TRINITY_DN3968_c0_g1_i1.p1  ORF type:complete len:387 (-),score=85.25 TRINITY_DN3968_c0_g1_i1:26-1186(-)